MTEKKDLILDLWDFFIYDKELEKKSLDSLIKELEKINKTTEEGDWTEEVVEKKQAIEDTIGQRLGLISQTTFEKWQEGVMELVADEIDSVFVKLRNHRHDYSKTFTGKAEY